MASPSSRTSPKSWAAPARRSPSSNATGRGFREAPGGACCGVVSGLLFLHSFASARGCARPPPLKHLLPKRDTARAMSQENVEFVRRGFEALNRDGVESFV